jgi:hypothetical protein
VLSKAALDVPREMSCLGHSPMGKSNVVRPRCSELTGRSLLVINPTQEIRNAPGLLVLD